MIKTANIIDLESIVELHMQNMDKKELSMILGENFVRTFYKLILQRKDTNINLVIYDNNVVAFSVIFLNYSGFETDFKKRAIIHLFKFLLENILSFSSLLNLYKTIKTKKLKNFIPEDIYNYHVGVFIIDNKHRRNEVVRNEFIEAYKDNIVKLKSVSSKFWGCFRVSNKGVIKLVKMVGMLKMVEMPCYPEKIIISIKD